jgi:aspartate/methionine/tyrosine aminotransferase
MEALSLSILCIVNEGDEVVIPSPGYVSYSAQVALAGARTVLLPLDERNGFRVTAANLEKALTKRTRLVILNSPSNPTGALEDRTDLKEIADLAKTRGVRHAF